ncbi:cupin domain-containing protein [Streptomyces sp. NBC_00091]|uniref:cupin domain-containing protein n=1 Tax=Streptomyces sp. NBC_00091 TaxID=2975648 RepID=UPI00224EE5FF|nr:cupin domain-containing protein [Streptomyces sp. NBC_00091]MCX5379746.1 cupin domain-containing protein [Streptomyces sp. NBC_00091]
MSRTDDLTRWLGLEPCADGGWASAPGGHDSYDGSLLDHRVMAFRTRLLDAGRPRTGWRRTDADTVLVRHPPHGPDTVLRLWTSDGRGRPTARPLGGHPSPDEPFQLTVPGGQWYALELLEGEAGLWSEAVVPGIAFGEGTQPTAPWPPTAEVTERRDGRRAGSNGQPLRELLGLTPHVEGGYFRQYYESTDGLETSRGRRPLANTIHYLLDRDSPVGYLHLNNAHITHFLNSGGPIQYLMLSPDGEVHEVVMGEDAAAGQVLAFTCPGGWWKSSRLPEGVSHGLISEIVAPGFDYRDQSLASADRIADQYPAAIGRLRPSIRG